MTSMRYCSKSSKKALSLGLKAGLDSVSTFNLTVRVTATGLAEPFRDRPKSRSKRRFSYGVHLMRGKSR